MAYTQRTADWVIQKAYLHATRKNQLPTNAKYTAMLGIIDSMTKLWEEEDGIEWSDLYQDVTLAAVVTATDTFALSTSINYISTDYGQYVQLTNGTNTTKYRVVRPDQLYQFREDRAVAKIGRNLKFSKAFASDSAYLGYNIVVPSITYCDDIALGTNFVQVTDPMWLVYMCAEEFIRQDIVKRATKADLLQLAQQVMTKMKQNEQGSKEALAFTGFINDGTDLL